MLTKRWMRVLAILFALSLIAAACGDDDDDDGGDTTTTAADDGATTTAAPEDGGDEAATTTAGAADGGDTDTLIIGTVLPETGALGFLGPPQIQGVELALEDLEAAGAPVEVITGDSGTDGAVAQETVNRLLGEGADAIIGAAASGVSQDMIQTLFDNRIPQCSASNTSPAFSDQENAAYYFRTVPPDEAVSPIIADRVATDGATNVAVVARADDYGNALAELVAEELTGLGVENSIITYDPENVAADAVVGEVGGLGADAVVLIAFDEGFPIIKAALEAGVPASAMYGADGLFTDTLNTAVDPENPNAIDGMTLIGASGGTEFNERLSELVGGNLIYGGQAYDCAIVLALAFAQAGTTDGDAMMAAITDVTNPDDGDVTCTSYEECIAAIEEGSGIDYDGAAGAIDLDDVGDPTFGRYAIAQFIDGVLTGVDSQDVDLRF